eukprot:13886762-Ditylum_brightwellii.AAC.1
MMPMIPKTSFNSSSGCSKKTDVYYGVGWCCIIDHDPTNIMTPVNTLNYYLSACQQHWESLFSPLA